MKRNKYNLITALEIIVNQFKDYVDIEDVEVRFMLNNGDEMSRLLSELEVRKVVDKGATANRNSIRGNYHVSKARELLENLNAQK